MREPGSSDLSYCRDESAYRNGKPGLGALDCRGATLFLKLSTSDGLHRFTLRTSNRDLKLKAQSESDYRSWCEALRADVRLGLGGEPSKASFYTNVEETADDDDD